MKKLIEVALPIKEISAESVRDKSLRHGHISTLHLWWARRPLAACRAIVFASLVPDPDDEECPQKFKDKVKELLFKDSTYKPYIGQEDTLRNRLLAFIAKWSKKKIDFESGKSDEVPETKELLDDNSLVKWESSTNPKTLKIAKELIIAAYGKNPTVLDPFAGGGAIPLEAVRLGCNVVANDYNPVAHIIERCTFEFPYMYGKPGKVKDENEIGGEKTVPNILAYDVELHAKNILERVKKKIGHLYPKGKDGNPVVGYIWARTTPCSNPTCRKEIPLLKSLLMCNKKNKRVALTLDIMEDEIIFGIAKNKDIKEMDGTTVTKGAKCPTCNQITLSESIKRASLEGKLGERIVCIITDTKSGKDYRPIEEKDILAFEETKKYLKYDFIPDEHMQKIPDLVSGRGWNFQKWGDLFNRRQLVALQTFIEEFKTDEYINGDEEYNNVVKTYIALWISRITQRLNTFCTWNNSAEKLQPLYGRQAIAMVWDYPEIPIISDSFGSPVSMLEVIIDFIVNNCFPESKNSILCLLGDSINLNLKDNSIDAVITDPPYFDAIAYADLSDFFYIWFKRTLGDIYPDVFSTPLVPKSEEATSLKHRHNGNKMEANSHFENKLTDGLKEARRLCKDNGLISIMFAHQDTNAWSSLINSIFNARLNITATYPLDTEIQKALKTGKATLESSVTVICKPRITKPATTYKDVEKKIEMVVKDSVEKFWNYGFRGADLIVACYGPAVGVVGEYEYVEKQGEPVKIVELLKNVREIALKAIAGSFSGDIHSRFYFVIANVLGTSEEKWDDVRLVAQIGCGEEDAKELADNFHLVIRNEDKCRLALLTDREKYLEGIKKFDSKISLIDILHTAMNLWSKEKQEELIQFLKFNNRIENELIWKLAQSLFEVLPKDSLDKKLINELFSQRESFRIQTRKAPEYDRVAEAGLFD